MALFRCAGCVHKCLREVSGQSESGMQPAWLRTLEHKAERGGQVVAAVQEVQLEHRLSQSFKEHGMVHERTKTLIWEIGAHIRQTAESEEDWQQKFVETIEGALPGWDKAMAKAAIAVAVRPADSLGRIIWEEPTRDEDGGPAARCYALPACRAGCISIGRCLTGISNGVSAICNAMARQCVQTPSGELTTLGDSWLAQRAFSGAAEAYQAASDSDRRPPYVADLHHRRALALLGLGRPHEGLDELRTALKLNPTHPPALYCFGSLVYSLRTGGEPMGHEAYMYRRIRDAAARATRRAQKQPLPTMKEAEEALGLAIRMSEDAKTRTEVRLHGSALAAAYNNHAVILAALENRSSSSQAAAQLQKALSLCSESSDVCLANVGLLLLSGQTSDTDLPAAIHRLRQLVVRRPQLPQAHHALAAALHRQGLMYSELADRPVSFGKADAPRREALAKRRSLVAEAAAHYRTALGLLTRREKMTYSASLDRTLRAGRSMNGVQWVRPAGADISNVPIPGYVPRRHPAPESTPTPDSEPEDEPEPEPEPASGAVEAKREVADQDRSWTTVAGGPGPEVKASHCRRHPTAATDHPQQQDHPQQRSWEFMHTSHAFESFRREALEGEDGTMGVQAQFHGDGITDIEHSIAGSILHAADISTSFWVWSRDPVQSASRAVVHAGLAASLLQLGQPENAMAQWRTALKIYPEFVTARYNLACALLDAHRDRQREQQRVEKQNEPREKQNEQREFDMESEAVRHLGIVLSLAPHHPKANNTIANWLALRGDRTGAAEHYARAGEHSDIGLSSLPSIGPVARGYPHSLEKHLSSALTARFAEHTVGHWNQPVNNTSASPTSRYLANDRVSERYTAAPEQGALPSSADSSAIVTASVDMASVRTAGLELGALPLMPSNSMIEPHSAALIAANPLPALIEARQPFGICRPASATPSSATWAERSTAITTSTSSPLKMPLAERQLLVLTGHTDTGRREEPPPTTVTHAGVENWKIQRMRDSRGHLDVQEEYDRNERRSLLRCEPGGQRGDATGGIEQPPQAVLWPLPGEAVSPKSSTLPKHLPGSEPDAIAAELAESLNRRAAPARGGSGLEDVWRGWMPVPSLPAG